MTRQEFCAYLRKTLIPNLRESGSEATVADFETALDFIAETDVRQLIENGLYFLASPESTDYIEVATSCKVNPQDTDLRDENGQMLPTGATVLFPN